MVINTYEINQIHVTFYLVRTYKWLLDMWITHQNIRFACHRCYYYMTFVIASYKTFVPIVQLQFTRLVKLCYLSLKTSLSHLHNFSTDSISSNFCWHCIVLQVMALQLNLGCGFSSLRIWPSLAISNCSLKPSICTVVFNFYPHIYL